MFPFFASGIIGNDVQFLELCFDLGGNPSQLLDFLAPKDNIEMAPDNSRTFVFIDFGQYILNFFKDHLILSPEIGTLTEFFYTLFEEFSPFVLIVQEDDLVNDMVFMKLESQTIYKPLMENKIIGSEPVIGPAAL